MVKGRWEESLNSREKNGRKGRKKRREEEKKL